MMYRASIFSGGGEAKPKPGLWQEMKIATGVEALELKGNLGTIHPTLVWDEDTAILVDAGFPGQLQEIEVAMERAGVPFSRLSKVIITHQDIDHIGALQEIVRVSEGKIEVLAHQEEKPYIEGEKPFIKMTPEQLATMFESLPEAQRLEAAQRFLESLKTMIDTTVAQGEVLPYCGGITVVHTPGHTPGHICLYLHQNKTLVSGDALNLVDGQLVGPNPLYTKDIKTAKESLGRFANFDIKTVICYHGGVYRDNVKQRLLELTRE